MSDRERRHGVTGEVMQGTHSEVVAIVPQTERLPRAELPVAVPAGYEAGECLKNDLGAPMGIREVAQLIGCSPWTVRQQCLRQGLPHFRASRTGRLIFYQAQVVAWILEHQQERRGRIGGSL